MLQKLLPAKWKITDQLELFNLQLKNCHKPKNVINFLQDMAMQRDSFATSKASKTFIAVIEADVTVGMHKHPQIPMGTRLVWQIANLDSRLSKSSEKWC